MELSKVKKATIGDLVRTSSCVGEPHANAVQCMKNGELTMFADIINEAVKDDLEAKHRVLPKEHWINQNLPGEDDKTLLLIAIDLHAHDFMDVLLRSGADPGLYNYDLLVTPLIFATKKADLESVQLLIKFGADVNTAAFNNGQTALHIAAYQGLTKIVTFLLSQPKIEVDLKDKKGRQTPLYLALKANDEESVRLLIAHNADLEHKIVGKAIREHLKVKFPTIDPEGIPKAKADLARQTSVTTLERLAAMIEDFENNDDVDLFKSLLVEVDDNQLEKFISGGHSLLQKGCYAKKSDLVQALLQNGANPDGIAEGSIMSPILISASLGDLQTLLKLLSFKANVKAKKISTEETILHFYFKQGENRKVEDLKELLEGLKGQLKAIINQKDINGNTALHYAAQRWPQEAVRCLLEAGANIGMKNQWGEVSITQILPETFEAFLTEFCMKANHADVNHENFELTFNYSFIAPSNENLPKNLQKLEDLESAEEVKLVNSVDLKTALPETEALWHMAQSKEHRYLLKHPVITSFLWLKWSRIRRYFNRNLRFYLLFVYILTWYIFQHFGGNSIKTEVNQSIPFFHGLYAAFSVLMIGFVLKDWNADLKDVIRVNQAKSDNMDDITGIQDGVSCKQIFGLVLSNWIEVALITGLIIILILGAESLYAALIILTSLLALREFFQITVSLRRYIFSPENWIEVSSIVIIGVILFHQDDEESFNALKRHLSAIVIVLSWAELITLVGKHPKLTRYNVYVTMFYKVMGTFFFFLIWYAFFIVAFGLAFYIMLHKDDGSPTTEEDYIYFNQPWLALVKTSTMFVGELEFSDIPVNLEGPLSPLAYLFFLSFVFLIVVVLMNLLNGLAVSDTGLIQEKAEIVTYISRVDTISYTESVLLGDPFDFLSNWPAFKWVKNIPSLSCCSQLYKHKTIQDVFHKITGATGILLFYSFMKEAKLTIRPNDRSAHCANCLNAEIMDASIVASAKKIISDQHKNDKMEYLEAKLNAIEQILISISQKLN